MSFATLFESAQKKRKQGKYRSSSQPDVSDNAKHPEVHVPKPRTKASSNVLDAPSNDERASEKRSRRKRRRKKESADKTDVPLKRGKKERPTKESLEVSEQLKSLSRQKQLHQALRLYWGSNEIIRDEHNACMLVDCCARCGEVTEAEKVVATFKKPNVEIKTALMKCYAKTGQMSKAQSLFAEMCRSAQKPNVRTLNTILRGSLWTPVAMIPGDELVGGVSTSEMAWQLYRQAVNIETLDTSSYEYTIILLCQTLDVQRAQERIEELQSTCSVRIKGKASFVGGDEHVLETLAVVYLALSRAYALLGLMDDTWLSCQRVLSAATGCRVRRESRGADQTSGERTSKTTAAAGGKRTWKPQAKEDQSARRLESNSAYRDHRLKEIEAEARAILKIRGEQSQPLCRQDLWNHLSKRLLYFPAGISAAPLAAASWYSFGGHIAGKSLGYDSLKQMKQDVIREDGTIDFKRVFVDSKCPLVVELGSGCGDWIVRAAATQPHHNHVAVELRADRAYQVFTKAVLEPSGPLPNVCVVGSDACSFLRDRIQPSSVSTMCVHHPEPPTQTYGSSNSDLKAIIADSAAEPAHMLRSETIVAAAKSLQANGKLVIVTDNRSYGRLVCATIGKVLRNDRTLLRGPTTNELKSSGLFLRQSSSSSSEVLFGDGKVGVALYEKQQGTYGSSSFSSGGDTTWFDRLWSTGVSSHAEQQTRFVILVYRRI